MIPHIVGVVLVVTAVAVGVHTVVEPLYHASTEDAPYSPFWSVLDVLMAVAIAIGVAFAYLRKRAAAGEGGGAVTRDFLAANTLFYGLPLLLGALGVSLLRGRPVASEVP